jgi:hypothetical protein
MALHPDGLLLVLMTGCSFLNAENPPADVWKGHYIATLHPFKAHADVAEYRCVHPYVSTLGPSHFICVGRAGLELAM